MKLKKYISQTEFYEIVESRHKDPHHVLGIHKSETLGYYINVFHPYAIAINVIDKATNEVFKMENLGKTGFFTVLVKQNMTYLLEYTFKEGQTWISEDPYRFTPTIGDLDIYLFSQGTHYKAFEKFGAHLIKHQDVEGVSFVVWAPNAQRVSVVGDFNGWDGRIHQMRNVSWSGLFEIFIPNVKQFDKYKFEIKTPQGFVIDKIDPFANYSEVRPNTASVVVDLNQYQWDDKKWLDTRENTVMDKQPMAIYECHLGSWKRDETRPHGFMNYKDIAHDLVPYVKDLGYTHIELMPVAEHPFDGSWGYQVTGYYAPTSRFGTPDDFMYFVDFCHKNNIGVILDWVPAHFPKDAHALIKFDGTSLFEHEDPKQGEHPHWGTMIFNVGRAEVKNFLLANAMYWLDKFHIDGLRVDAVASMLYLDYGKEAGQWVPNIYGGRENLEAVEFFKHLNSMITKEYPGTLMIAEESTAWPGVSRAPEFGGLGFDMKWNMGWMNDFLTYIEKEPIHRKYHHNDLTFSMVYAYTENFILVLSHDEVVHGKGSMIGKMPGDYWQKFANLRVAYGFMYGHPGKKLVFMGGEFGQFDEWNEAVSLQWNLLEYEKHSQLLAYTKALNHVYTSEKAFSYDDFQGNGFEWINGGDWESSTVSFMRKTDQSNETIICIANFTPVPRLEHSVGVPFLGKYKEILNSDHVEFGGSGVINGKSIASVEKEYDGRPYTLTVKVPPLGITMLKFKG